MTRRFLVLLVEDNPGDAAWMQEALHRGAGMSFDVVHVATLEEAKATATRERPDVVVLDLGLPDSKGLETLRGMHSAWPDLPIVVMTGMRDVAMAVEAIRIGAQDYLVKDMNHAARLPYVVHLAVVAAEHRRFLQEVDRDLEATRHPLEKRVERLARDILHTISAGRASLEAVLARRPAGRERELLAGVAAGLEGAADALESLASAAFEARPANYTHVDLGAVLDEVAAETRLRRDDKVTHGDLPTLMASAPKIRQLFRRALAVSLAFRRQDGPLAVHVDYVQDAAAILITYQDNGMGLGDWAGPVAATPFLRLGSDDPPPGSGTHLALCKNALEHHGGSLAIQRGAGLSLEFRFPPARAARPSPARP